MSAPPAREWIQEQKIQESLAEAVTKVISERPEDPLVAMGVDLIAKAKFGAPPTYLRPTAGELTLAQQEAMKKGLAGITVLLFGEDGYNSARAASIEGEFHPYFPAAIVQPKSESDVVKVVKYLISNSLPFSVRGGGHSPMWATGMIILDMCHFNTVTVNTKSSPITVTVQGAARAGQIDQACAPLGVATVCGNYPTTGYVGQMMGGGIGYMARWKGMGVDQVVSIRIVLADGSIVDADAKNAYSDLFWAVRGGGGNFGVVLSVVIKTFPIGWDDNNGPGRLLAGERVLMPPDRNTVFKKWVDYAMNLPDHVSADTFLIAGGPMIQCWSYKGPIAEAREEEKKWNSFGDALMSNVDVKPYAEFQQHLVPTFTPDLPFSTHWAVINVGAFPEAAIDIILHASGPGAPNDKGTLIHIERMGGVISNPPDGRDSAAFSQRDSLFWIAAIGIYGKNGNVTPLSISQVDAWLAKLVADLQPHIIKPGVTGSISQIPEPVNVWNDKVEKLRGIKKKYDPNNAFHIVMNGMTGAHNIKP